MRGWPTKDFRVRLALKLSAEATPSWFRQSDAWFGYAMPTQLLYRRGAGPTPPRKRLRCLHSNLLLDRHGQSAWRYHDRREHQSPSGCRRSIAVGARIANAVGTTQFTVSGTHGQPDFSKSKRTCRSAVRNFHFHNQLDSWPDRRLGSECPPTWPA